MPLLSARLGSKQQEQGSFCDVGFATTLNSQPGHFRGYIRPGQQGLGAGVVSAQALETVYLSQSHILTKQR